MKDRSPSFERNTVQSRQNCVDLKKSSTTTTKTSDARSKHSRGSPTSADAYQTSYTTSDSSSCVINNAKKKTNTSSSTLFNTFGAFKLGIVVTSGDISFVSENGKSIVGAKNNIFNLIHQEDCGLLKKILLDVSGAHLTFDNCDKESFGEAKRVKTTAKHITFRCRVKSQSLDEHEENIYENFVLLFPKNLHKKNEERKASNNVVCIAYRCLESHKKPIMHLSSSSSNTTTSSMTLTTSSADAPPNTANSRNRRVNLKELYMFSTHMDCDGRISLVEAEERRKPSVAWIMDKVLSNICYTDDKMCVAKHIRETVMDNRPTSSLYRICPNPRAMDSASCQPHLLVLSRSAKFSSQGSSALSSSVNSTQQDNLSAQKKFFIASSHTVYAESTSALSLPEDENDLTSINSAMGSSNAENHFSNSKTTSSSNSKSPLKSVLNSISNQMNSASSNSDDIMGKNPTLEGLLKDESDSKRNGGVDIKTESKNALLKKLLKEEAECASGQKRKLEDSEGIEIESKSKSSNMNQTQTEQKNKLLTKLLASTPNSHSDNPPPVTFKMGELPQSKLPKDLTSKLLPAPGKIPPAGTHSDAYTVVDNTAPSYIHMDKVNSANRNSSLMPSSYERQQHMISASTDALELTQSSSAASSTFRNDAQQQQQQQAHQHYTMKRSISFKDDGILIEHLNNLIDNSEFDIVNSAPASTQTRQSFFPNESNEKAAIDSICQQLLRDIPDTLSSQGSFGQASPYASSLSPYSQSSDVRVMLSPVMPGQNIAASPTRMVSSNSSGNIVFANQQNVTYNNISGMSSNPNFVQRSGTHIVMTSPSAAIDASNNNTNIMMVKQQQSGMVAHQRHSVPIQQNVSSSSGGQVVDQLRMMVRRKQAQQMQQQQTPQGSFMPSSGMPVNIRPGSQPHFSTGGFNQQQQQQHVAHYQGGAVQMQVQNISNGMSDGTSQHVSGAPAAIAQINVSSNNQPTMIMTQQHPNQHHPQQQHLMMARATSGGSTEFVRMQQPHSNVSGRNNQQQYWNSNMPQPNGFPPQQLAPMGQMSRYNTANNSFKSNSTSDAVAVSVSNNTMYCMVPPGSIRAPNSGQPTPPPGSVVTSQSPRMHGTQFQMVPRDGMQSPSQANFMPTNQSPVAVSTAAQYSMNTWDYQNQQQASQHNQAANQHIMQSSPNHPPGAVSNTQQMQATSHFPNSGDSSSQSGQVAAQQVKMFGQSGGGGAGAPANSGGENKSLLQQLLCENPG